MKKRLYYAIAAIVLFFGIGAILDFGISKEDHLDKYASRIERNLHKKELEVNALISDTEFVNRQLEKVNERTTSQHFANLASLEKLVTKNYNLCIYRGDSLLFWLNNLALLNQRQLDSLPLLGEGGHMMELPNGYFEVFEKPLPDGLTAVGLIPLKMDFAKKSESLPNSFFAADLEVPEDVILSVEPTQFSIKNGQGKTLAWLDANGPAKNRNHLRWVFFIYVLGFVALGVLVNDIAVALVRRFQPWVGAAFMLAAVIGIRWITVELGFTKHFEEFETFSEIFTQEILEGVTSLGELLINIILLVWMMVFFNREFLVKEFVHPSKAIRFSLTTLNFFAINLGILMVSGIFKAIILDSEIIFDFENVFNLNSQSVLAMIGVVLLLLALFLFSHRMMTAIHKIGMEKNWRLSGMALALLLTIPVVYFGELRIPIWHFMAAVTLYLVIFEYFIEMPNMTLGWLVGWVMLYAGLSSMLLYKYNGDKDFKRRMEFAKALTDYEDPVADKLFQDMVPSLYSKEIEEEWGRLQQVYQAGKIPWEYAKDIYQKLIKDDRYLYNNYTFDIYAFNLKDGGIALTEQTASMSDMEIKFQNAKMLAERGVRFMQAATREPGHLIRIPIRTTSDPLLVFLKFKRSFSRPSKVYTALQIEHEYKDLRKLDDYDYGIYQDSILVEEWNKAYIKYLSDVLPPVGDSLIQKYTSKRSDLLYHADDGLVVKIGKDTGGYIKPLSLFSYVFTLLAIAVLIFGLINYMTNALPGPLNFFRSAKPSLRNQFQFWVVGMILFSFLGIGIVSVWYFQQSSENYHKGRLSRKVSSALANVNYEIISRDRELQEIKDIRAQINEDLILKLGSENSMDVEILEGISASSLINLISDVHRLDVNIYDLEGDLIASSEEDIFKQGIVAPKMGAYAFQELTKFGFEQSNQSERIGDLEYTAAYFPLKSMKGETMAYMGIPYYARQRDLAKDVTDFMSTLLNVYVFLLLIAGGLAIVIANAITRALSELRENLGRLQLGGNQALEYKRKDEIGELVDAYNEAVKKIELSSKLLEQSAQDHAWREMAKQIAHEIKNPLTPMKLSIQYLLHAYQSNPQDAEPLLKRVTKTLIEQIDSLAQIASEFSNFAKMPKPENSEFSLNDLAASVHHLFANERSDMELSIDLPENDFEVFADRNHLTRVLNNLYKNAIQAIPDDRKGIINLSLYDEEEKAILRISDNGSGIPPEIQKKVFTPNFSTKTSGTGLGLAICKSIVQSFNGDIYFKTEEGIGTTFYVELPLRKVTEPA